MTKNSGQIERELDELASKYALIVKREINEIDDSNLLISLAASNTGTWSGGACVKNMAEQIKRNFAIKRLQDLQYRTTPK